jgi:hypothetical protein
VSQAGRLINTLMRPEKPAGGATANLPQSLVESSRPVANGPLAQSEPLARALASALSGSGLFYESHVAQWVNGSRSLEQLRQEPQFHWTEKNLAGTQGDAASRALPGTEQTSGLNARAGANPVANGAAADTGMVEAFVQTGPEAPALNIAADSDAAQMMRLQLDTLEHGQVLWRGEAWPGLPMEWGVAEDGGNGEQAQRSWQSVLRFHFEKLGTVAATLTLSGGQVQLALRTENDAVTKRLQGAATELADAMKSAGTPLHLMTVRQENAP